ncbi:unnamed protein product, partial [Prorocentrum cordatum]
TSVLEPAEASEHLEARPLPCSPARQEARWSSGGDWRAALAQLIPLLAGLQEALAGGRRRRRRARSAARAAGGGSPPGRGRGERRLLWARFPPAGRSSSSQP